MASEPRRERKVISVAFADLVGFTARAESLDPEDVEAFLQPYHEQVRGEFERFGGTVEKFIGDAIVAIFGAPVAHEDDPERAVRAALAIRDRLADQGDLSVRIAVTTGEAIVRLDAAPERGEGLATGDVLNTASRLQGAAPPNGILVDRRTYDATRAAIRYADDPAPVDAKGKAEPVEAWLALEALARFGVDVQQSRRTPLVGRDRERSILLDTLARVESDASPQLVTVVGVPGIGKSRLVYELFADLQTRTDLRYWRQGRSLPYGEGVSLWALSEMVKAQAGVHEADDDAAVDEKLRRSVLEAVGEEDAGWVAGALRPLVGLEGAAEGVRSRRDESFTAWRRFFEGLAERYPLVLVFEDLHWADDTLLDFVEHLVDWSSGVPILVLCTTRPELLERRPGWGGGRPNSITLGLSSLSDADSARLVSLVLETPVLAAEAQQLLLERSGGNPLYAEQFAKLLQEQGTIDEAALPASIQGLIAARLDHLSPEEKSLIQDASVMGKVFWSGGLPAGDRRDALLHGLERKEFIRRERRSSVAGQDEYAFRHVLVRDVAYGQIPRADRVAKHVAAAAWIENLGRPQDHAELVAHHYNAALALSSVPLPEAVLVRARDALIVAGERAFALSSFAAAARYNRAALDLLAPDDPRRARTLYGLGMALFRSRGEGGPELAAAVEALIAAGDPALAAEAECRLTTYWWERGERARWMPHLERAAELVLDLPPSPSKTFVLAARARYLYLSGAVDEADMAARAALAMAESLGLDELRAHALNTTALVTAERGPGDGYALMLESIAIADARNSIESYYGYNNLSVLYENAGRMPEANAAWAESLRVALRFGAAAQVRWARFTGTYWSYVLGDWDGALRETERLLSDPTLPPGYYMVSGLIGRRALILLARGDDAQPQADMRESLAIARASGDPQQIIPALAAGASVLLTVGDVSGAQRLADELLALPGANFMPVLGSLVPFQLRALVRLGVAEQFVGRFATHRASHWLQAAGHVVAGDWAAAADIYEAIGARPDAAIAQLEAARALVAAGRRRDADVRLQAATAFFRSVRATRYLAMADELLAATA
jgi:class 3 adenylate cyclase/tetratricopeptide (TPR) repeat protein